MQNKILINGSVVFDTIFGKTFYGGTGGNIAYKLGKLGVRPMLFSLVGPDFEKDYSLHLKKCGVDLRAHVNKKGATAHFYLGLDKKGKEISSWEPNTYKKIDKISHTKTISARELKKVTIAIFSPGTPESIYKHLAHFRNLASTALAIFDPGQMINFYSKKQIEKCFALADILIVNELEYKQMKKIIGNDPVAFFLKKNKFNKIIIKTEGAKGSVIFQNGKKIKIKAVHPKRVIDTTGAGDAYRAGLIFGLWRGIPLAKACALGARLAAKNIQYAGCQNY